MFYSLILLIINIAGAQGPPPGAPIDPSPTKGELIRQMTQNGTVSVFGDQPTGSNPIVEAILAALLKGFSVLVFGINYVIGLFGGMFFALGGALIQLGLALNNNIISSPIVQVGWVITRDLANLGFVVAIIYIAFTTILRLAGHDTKQLLFRLLVAALLINFSLTIVSYLIGAGDILSNYFINKVTPTNVGQTNNFAVNLASIFKVQELLDVKKPGDLPDIKGGMEFGGAIFGLISSIFFVAFFTSIAALTILTIAFMIFARYVALSILIILMPMAWLLWIFPYFSGQFKAWWSKFISWLIFLPVATFFLYLTILMVTNYAQDAASVSQLSQRLQLQTGTFLNKFLATVATPLATASQMIVIIGLLLAGLKAANVSGEQAAGIAIGLAEKTHGWMTGRIKGAGRQIRRGAAQRFWQRQVAEEDGQPISRAERWSRRLSALPIPGFRGIASTIGRYTKGAGDEIEEYRKANLDVLSKEALLARAKDRKIIGPIQAAAIALQLAKKDLTDKIDNLEFYLKSAQKFGKDKEILDNRPDLAPIVGKTIKDVMNKLAASKADAISADALKIKEVVISLDSGHLQRLGREGTEEKRKNVKETIKAIRDEMRAGNTFAGQTKSAQEMTEILDELNKIDKFIINNPQWQA